MLGQLLDGRYQVLQVLAGGGFSQTYIAQDTHRPGLPKCVVKHLKPVTRSLEFLETARQLFDTKVEAQLPQAASFTQPPQTLLSQPNSISYTSTSILSPENYNRLEKILLEFVGPLALRLLQEVATSAPNFEELISQLAVYLRVNQQTDFQKKTMFLLEKPTLLQEHTIDEMNSNNLLSQENQLINDKFVEECERELADLIGPIAKFLVQKAVKSSGQISRAELVKILAAKITEPQKAFQFEQHLLS